MNERVNRLAAYISSLAGFEAHILRRAPYQHMGAVIADAVLQAGVSYRSVVAPRVERLIRTFPDASTTSTFVRLIETVGPHELLLWRHEEKPRRLVALTTFFASEEVETCAHLLGWLIYPENHGRLLSVRGVGPKTADYIATLVGLPSVAVDRHVKTFVAAAGLMTDGYQDTRGLVIDAATALGVNASELDHAIWSYMQSNRAGCHT